MSDPKDDDDGTSPKDEAGESADAAPSTPDSPAVVRRKALSSRMFALCDLIKAHARDVIRPMIVAEITGAKMSAEEIEEFVAVLRDELRDEGATDEEIETATSEAREGLTRLGQGDDDEIDKVCDLALEDAAPLILTAWINTLGMSASRHSGAAWLRRSFLGDDMLPTSDGEATAYFADEFANGPITPAAAKDVLRKVRASLPVGTVIPDDATAALELAWEIIVIP